MTTNPHILDDGHLQWCLEGLLFLSAYSISPFISLSTEIPIESPIFKAISRDGMRCLLQIFEIIDTEHPTFWASSVLVIPLSSIAIARFLPKFILSPLFLIFIVQNLTKSKTRIIIGIAYGRKGGFCIDKTFEYACSRLNADAKGSNLCTPQCQSDAACEDAVSWILRQMKTTVRHSIKWQKLLTFHSSVRNKFGYKCERTYRRSNRRCVLWNFWRKT